MNGVFFDASLSDDDRRERLYAGDIHVYSPRASTLALVMFVRELIEDAFHPLDPERAQHEMPVERFAEILGELKPRFIHHPVSSRHVTNVLADLGCDLDEVYLDAPRLRSSTSDGYLTKGIAYAWHPHRDTWYSAPPCQLNWWLPVFPIESRNAMAFHPSYWNRPVANTSAEYNYYRWNREHRGSHVSGYVKEDPRPLPRATEPMDLDPQMCLVPPPGGVITFSGAQMHSSVPNTSGKTRWSVDFRTVHVGDAGALRGAPRTDERCTGTTMRDYRRGADGARMPEDVIEKYCDGSEDEGRLVYEQPSRSATA